jgi:hypothetical protein
MKKVMTTLAATAALALTTMATPALADGNFGYGRPAVHPVYAPQHPLAGLREINFRQEEQRARIERGFHRGAITRWEFRRLMAEQQDIQALERAFVADGHLSPREHMELTRRLDMASANIRFEARDHQRRF